MQPQPPRWRIVILPLAATLLVSASPGSAQDQSPLDCPLEPIALPLFGATPAATIVATPGHDTPAPAATDAEIEDAVGTLVTCANSESPAQRYAIFTERYLASLFTGEQPADQPAFERMLATGSLPDAMPSNLNDVTDIERQDDGRIAVTVHIDTAEGDVTDRLLLAWDDASGAWLVDEVVTLDPIPAA